MLKTVNFNEISVYGFFYILLHLKDLLLEIVLKNYEYFPRMLNFWQFILCTGAAT